ncbi:MAG: Na+:solute symporter [Gemmatimonadota bacterium]|nr:MAG: Na+:solute symporter [Gemmatimonadota bacterium]
MNLHPIDLLIIATYMAATIGIGFWISKLASRSIQNYFLGGNTIPWYMLGLSNASGMFDISGTMWMVYLLFLYGLKSVWIPWLWPVFNQIFLMVYLSIWLRRSGVMTGAEWITFRFGRSRGANLAHVIVVLFAILNVIGFLAYGFIGIGKFAATFLPWELSADPTTNVNLYGLIITAITTLYVVKGGMFSVVFTEVLQFIVMTIACIAVGLIAMYQVSPAMLDAVVPDGWHNMFFGWRLDLDWTGILDAAAGKIQQDGWELFSIFFMLMLFKGYLQAMAGPAPNYDMQRVLSARTPKEAAKMSGFVSVVLLIPRYMLITGLTVLALVFFSGELNSMGDAVDFEMVLPFAMREFVPIGLLGLLIAGLLAAFMSTYAATVNAAPAYIVNDIYKRYINPNASERRYVWMSYTTSLVVVVVGTAFGFFIPDLNTIVLWIVGALYGGYTAANLLKWYWWRFNSYGYFWGMAAGIAAAGIVPTMMTVLFGEGAFGEARPVYGFPIILAFSLIGCIAGSLLTKPDDEVVLKNFYLKVRPWGFWKPIHDKLKREHTDLELNRCFKRDMLNIVVGIFWQTALTATGIFLVIEAWTYLLVSVAVTVVTSIVLKYNWYDKMENHPKDLQLSAD